MLRLSDNGIPGTQDVWQAVGAGSEAAARRRNFLARRSPWPSASPAPAGGVTTYPRLLLHDLVLQRRTWKLGTDSAIPATPTPGEHDG
jgi:hypothetical protein